MNQLLESWVGEFLASGRYQVKRILGAGGMADVYLAHDRNLKTDVVVKVPRLQGSSAGEFAQRFECEVCSLVRLSHPHVVRILDVSQHQGVPFAVMPYLTGGSLENRRPANPSGRLRLESVRSWLGDVAAALDFIHSRGYVHRDIKPGNILFDEHGHVYLSDFGIAKAFSTAVADSPSEHYSDAGMIIGTPGYMAPEVSSGEAYDGRSDQYSLAVMVYELLSGRRPFGGQTSSAVLTQQTTQTPPPLSNMVVDLPPSVCAAVHRALDNDPANRFPTCRAFADALHDKPDATSQFSPTLVENRVIPIALPDPTRFEPVPEVPKTTWEGNRELADVAELIDYEGPVDHRPPQQISAARVPARFAVDQAVLATVADSGRDTSRRIATDRGPAPFLATWNLIGLACLSAAMWRYLSTDGFGWGLALWSGYCLLLGNLLGSIGWQQEWNRRHEKILHRRRHYSRRRRLTRAALGSCLLIFGPHACGLIATFASPTSFWSGWQIVCGAGSLVWVAGFGIVEFE